MSAFLFVLEIVYNLILCENNIRDIYCQLCINTLKNWWCVQNGMAVDNNMNTLSQSLILFRFAQKFGGFAWCSWFLHLWYMLPIYLAATDKLD